MRSFSRYTCTSILVAFFLGVSCSSAFSVASLPCKNDVSSARGHVGASRSALSSTSANAGAEIFEVTVDLPGAEVQAKMRIKPVLSVPSEIIQVRYKLPFDLSVEPKKNLAVCTKDGTGGEKVNDVLRFTTQWTIGLPRGEGGLLTTVAAFSGGGLGWQCSLFDVMAAKSWGQVVEALTTNVPSRTDEVVLLFERPLEGVAPELQ